MFRRATFLALPFLALPTTAIAQDAANTILVLDGSGSMWGQIDGINKIVIARDVVGTLLDDFPSDQNLGLTVYGHRERGNCADIETVVAPGQGTLGAIREAVNGINPRGKTPMTDAVIAAAEALRYTEEKATVVLVSDGIETCNPDPCAAARALEAAGIDFTAHVIGFDVTDPEALAQMQCLANETGGSFLTASNADELTEALTTVAVAPEPEPVPQTIRIVGVLSPGGAEIGEAIDWTISAAGTSATGSGPGFAVGLEAGNYAVRGVRLSDGTAASQAFDVAAATENAGDRIEVLFPEPAPEPVEVTFRAVIGDAAGELITDPVIWDVTGAEGAIAEGSAGNPITVEMVEGSYNYTAYWTAQETEASAQFVIVSDARTITAVFEPPALTATITAPASAPLGSTIEVGWNGPDLELDYIGIGAQGATGADQWKNFFYSKDGNPMQLLVPPQTGPHVIRYFLGKGRDVIGETVIEVTDIDKGLTVSETAVAGSEIEVAFVGPDYKNDYIGIGKTGEGGAAQWENWTYTRNGNPAKLQVPVEPGEYTVTYFLDQDRQALVQAALTVVEVQATLTAPAEAIAGSTVEVGWTGPDYRNDYIGVGTIDATGAKQWDNYTLTREGSPLMLKMPAEPGDYLIRYFANQDRTALAEAAIKLTPVTASVTAPANAAVGATVEVGWTGPDYRNDFIGIGKVGATGSRQWENYQMARDGNPAQILMPTEPGDYLIQYFLDQGRTPIATATITLSAVQASITAPAEAAAGSTIEVGWTGPDYPRDFIGIGRADATGSRQWEEYQRTGQGEQLAIRVPATPGDYVIRYFVNQDRSVLAEAALTVTAVQAALTAPANAPAGSTIDIGWDGPGYDRDFIGIGRAGATSSGQWEQYQRVSEGNPVRVRVPSTPGDYEITYFLDQDRVKLASLPFTVDPVEASVTAPATAAPGQEIEIGWTGPAYPRDFIAIGLEGATGSGQWKSYQRIEAGGGPVMLTVPDAPGKYLVRYYMDLDRTILAEETMTVE